MLYVPPRPPSLVDPPQTHDYDSLTWLLLAALRVSIMPIILINSPLFIHLIRSHTTKRDITNQHLAELMECVVPMKINEV